MAKNLKEALNNVQMAYTELVEIADKIVEPYIKPMEDLIDRSKQSTNRSNEDIRQLLFDLSVNACSFCEVKEKSALKLACAETLKDEINARKFNEAEGAIKVKENIALLESNYEILSEVLYNEVYSMLKTKLDSYYRFVDTLKSILISRAADAKLSSNTNIGQEE